MKAQNLVNTGIKLSLSDWLLLIAYAVIYPTFISGFILTLGIVIERFIIMMLSLMITALIIFGIVLFYFYETYSELRYRAIEVGYFHFKPSWKDVLFAFMMQIFQISFLGVIFYFIFISFIQSTDQYEFYFGIAIILSVLIQGVMVFFAMNSKKKLFATAQEPLKPEILDHLRKNHPNSHLIHDYRFADIKPASLFLSAGVTTWTWNKNICMISRYFNWKLSDEELIAVLSHEEGHLVGNDIKNTYKIIGTDALLRVFKFFIVLQGLVFIFNSDLLLNDFLLAGIFILFVLIVYTASALLNFIQRYRMYLQEIRADYYGSTLVGNEVLAQTLKKLPSVIPAPISTNPLEFLGFRISILRERARKLGEKSAEKYEFSRFSSN